MKKPLALSYLAQIYSSLIGVVLMPIYLKLLGGEVFGLVGFSIMVQAWIQLLDLGMSPALSREMSRFRAGTLKIREIAVRLRTLEVMQFTLGSLAIASMAFSCQWISEKWLDGTRLSSSELAVYVFWIGLAAFFRWFTGLYKAALVGLEKQNVNILVATIFTTLRYCGVVPVIIASPNFPLYFFVFQTCVNAFELVAYVFMVYRILELGIKTLPNRQSFWSMFPIVKSMTFLSLMWIVVSQIDKLVLSGLLSLEKYGQFMLAAMAAGGVLILVPPLNQVVQPRMTILAERKLEKNLEELYRLATQVSVVTFFGIGGGLAFYAEPILKIWTGSEIIAQAAAPMLFWYGLANAVVGISVLPFMLQFARGKLNLHMLGNLLMLLFIVPMLMVSAICWGGVGAGRTLLVGNILWQLLWVPFVHRRFMPSVSIGIYLRDTWLTAGLVVGWFAMSVQLIPGEIYGFSLLLWVGFVTFIGFVLGALSSDRLRIFAGELMSQKLHG